MTVVSKKQFRPAPEGMFLAVCVDEYDLGLVKTFYGIKRKHRLSWQLEEIDSETGKPWLISKKYTPSLADKSNLRHDLESWRGKAMTKEELKAFDLENIVGKMCQLQVIHNENDGETYANVQNIMPAPKGSIVLIPVGYTRMKDRPQDQQPKIDTGGDGPNDETPF
jgi:hypothetical protein